MTKMRKLNFQYAMKSVIGTREEQQDFAIYKEIAENFVAIVCDGMGGLNGGSVASKVAAETFIHTMENKGDDENIPQLLLRSVDIMDEKVFSLKNDQGAKLNAGTTFVAVVIENDNVYWLSIGDSRLYIMRNNEFMQVTRDHNYELILSSMPPNYVPSEDELNRKEALVSFVGMGGIEIMDLSQNPVKLLPGDKLLLTTDGLFKALPDNLIKAILDENSDAETTADKLITNAENNSIECRDNITLIYIDIKENE